MLGSWILPILIDLVALLPAWLLGRKQRIGWLVMFVEMAVLWPIYAVSVGGWGWFPGIVAHSALAVRGWYLWRT